MASLYPEKSAGAAGLPGRPVRAAVPSRCLEDLAALLGAVLRVAGLGPALSLAGILALARVRGALAGALALAGVDAAALHAVGVRRRGEGAGREDRDGGGDDGALGHDVLPQDVASLTNAAGGPCARSTRGRQSPISTMAQTLLSPA